MLGRFEILVVFAEKDLRLAGYRLAAWGLSLGLAGPGTSRATSRGVGESISIRGCLLTVRALGGVAGSYDPT